ncbi:MAG: hypothetical protein AB3N20_13965 [Rhizobiaceae bacterium]
MTQKIHYAKPSITELEVEYATDAVRNGWGSRYSPVGHQRGRVLVVCARMVR